MHKFYMVVLALVLTAGCAKETLHVVDNTDRVTDLEKRAALNDQLNADQSSLIALNAASISVLNTRVTSLESGVAQLQSDLLAETQARIDGDNQLTQLNQSLQAAMAAGDQANADALQAAINQQVAINAQVHNKLDSLQAQLVVQGVVNLAVQAQLALINSKFGPITSSLSNLQGQINNTNNSVSALQSAVSTINTNVSGLTTQMTGVQSSLTELQSQITALTTRLNAEGVKVYKCNAPTSEERFFKINGKYYGAMNQIELQQVTVVTGSTSQTTTTPSYCVNSSGDMKTPNPGGQCTPNSGPNAYTLVPGTTTTIPSYSTGTVTLVKSVQISLEELLSGSNYVTTDGTTPCTFNGNGTNLVQVN